jgi:hypothetical protein
LQAPVEPDLIVTAYLPEPRRVGRKAIIAMLVALVVLGSAVVVLQQVTSRTIDKSIKTPAAVPVTTRGAQPSTVNGSVGRPLTMTGHVGDRSNGPRQQVVATVVLFLDPAPAEDQRVPPSFGQRLVAVHFKVAAEGAFADDAVPTGVLQVVDDAGHHYGALPGSGLTVLPGSGGQRSYVFAVPAAAHITQVLYLLDGPGGPSGSWQVRG